MDHVDRYTPEDLDALRAAGRVRRYRAGAAVFREGERCDSVFLLESGRIKIVQHTREGTEEVLAIRGAGDVVGEMSAVSRDLRNGTGTALEDVTAVRIPADDFRRLLVDRPELTLRLVEHLVHRLHDSDAKRAEFGTSDTTVRVARRLVELGERYGIRHERVLVVQLPITQADLAGWVGASREAVVKALAALRQEGCIETGRREIRIVDLAALEKIAGV